MGSFNTGSATIDKYLQIKKADEAFYTYIGAENFTSLVKTVHPADLPRLSSAVEELKEEGYNIIAYRIKRADGRYRWILAELQYETVELDGEALISINIQDVQNLEREISAIKTENAEFDEFFGLLDELFFIYDLDEDDFRVFMGGRQTVNLVHSTLEEWMKDVEEKEYLDPDYKEQFQHLYNDIRNGVRTFKYEIRSKEFSVNKDLEMLLFKAKTIRNSLRERKVIGFISVIGEDSKKKQINYNVESNKDTAMDILNKKAITDYARKLLASNPKNDVHIGIVDLDNFKNINDTYGHLFGDEVLAVAAGVLKEAVGDKGVVGRIGGDEMMFVLDRVASYSDLRGVLRTIRSNIEWYYKDKKKDVNLTTSMGIASYPAHGKDYDELFKIADKMLYMAKKKGKNRYVLYTPKIHGDVLHSDIDTKIYSVRNRKIDKEKLILIMIDDFLRQKTVSYDKMLGDILLSFGLEEIEIFYGDVSRPAISFRDDMQRNQIDMIEYARSEKFAKLYNENGLAVIDHLSDIEGTYQEAYDYLKENGVEAALVYRMSKEKKEGYVAFYKLTEDARKWSDSDKAYLNYAGKILELSLDDR